MCEHDRSWITRGTILIAYPVTLNRASLKRRSIALTIFAISIVALLASPSHATIYFYYDAEDGMVGSNIPEDVSGIYFEQSSATGYTKGTVRSSIGAPQGAKYFGYDISQNQHDAQNDIRDRTRMPFTPVEGTTYYIGVFFNFMEINNNEIYYTDASSISGYECFDKGIEMSGDGLRWITGMGMRQWETLETELPPHYWSHWLGNPSHHLNPELESYDAFFPNQSGYSSTHWPYITSNQWHSLVLAVKMSKAHAGSASYWIDGVKISEYLDIQTLADVDVTIDRITINGTLCQNYYNIAGTMPHIRNYDALILTDEWQDIVDGGYLSVPKTPCPANPVKMEAGEVYQSVMEAYVGAASGDNILVQAIVFDKPLSLERDITVALRGGYYECNFSSTGGLTTVPSLSVRNGTVTIDKLIIR
jgi:hypothetical protein